MANQRVGHYVVTRFGGEVVRAYVPLPLPPDPPVQLERFHRLLDDSNQAIGRLDGLASLLPDLNLFLYAYVRKEAVVSSQIEGTQSSISDLLRHENQDAPGLPTDDVGEVSNYIAALNHGLARLRGGFPLSLRLIREIHGVLLAEGRGSDKEPGEFRRSQNWIGGSRPGNAVFVPPPVEELMNCLGALETFLHDDRPDLPLLVKAGLVHAQFETIHPFLDGNGRVGRLLITFLLCAAGALREPMLYLSLYFKTNRDAYYDLLTRVRTHGDWESWIEFFLTGVRQTATQAVDTARRILALLDQHRRQIETLGRPATTTLRVFHHMLTHPITPVTRLARETGVSFPTASQAVRLLSDLGILREVTGRERGRWYAYEAYVAIIGEGAEPIPPRVAVG